VGVVHLDGVALDGDAALTLEVHIIELLVHPLAFSYGLGKVEEAVGEGTLAVVDVGDYTEVANILHTGAKITLISKAEKL
jgi:hypothetical protein